MKLPSKKKVAKFLAESNQIEGIEIAWEHLYTSLLSGPTLSEYLRNKHIYNSIHAWEYVLSHRKKIITLKDILNIHQRQMEGLMPTHETGSWRTGQVFIGNHTPPKASVLHLHMDQWIKSEEKNKHDPIIMHQSFERIHPFWDGNGRVGRLIYAWQMLREHSEYFQPILQQFEGDSFLKKRWSYYQFLSKGR